MKTPKFRVWLTGLAVGCLALGGGYEDTKAPAELRTDVPDSEPLIQVDDAQPLDIADGDVDADPGDEGAPPSPAASTNAAGTNAIKLVQEPVVPEKVSPELQEIVKLIQAGLSEEVILSYITNSTNAFSVDADDLVYLNDLGVSTAVVTAIIQQDNTAEARAKKHAMVAVKPLPPGAGLTKPATNIYKQGLYAPSESIPMGDLPPAYEETEPATTYAPPEAEQQPVTVNYFYNYLSPYGSWVDVPDYGLCWRPTVAVTDPYWRPYSHNGRWLWTDHGWYWYSDYSWGWAPFHYGRWCSYPGYGWVWAPDTHWGPAWVTWRYSKYYCGWAPLPPRSHYVSGFGLYYRNSSVSISYGFGLGPDCYTFIPINRFCDRKPGLYYCNPRDGRRVYRDSVVINNYVSGKNNTVINRGIGVERVQQANRGDVPRAQVRRTALAENGRRAERIENDGSTPVVVAPTVPRPARASGNVAARAPRNGGNKGGTPASSLAPTSPAASPAPASAVGNSGAPNRPAASRNPVARANSPREGVAPRGNVAGRGNDHGAEPSGQPNAGTGNTPRHSGAPVPRPPSQTIKRQGNVTIAGATPIPSATPGHAASAATEPRPGAAATQRPGQAAHSRSSVLGSRLIAGSQPQGASGGSAATPRPSAGQAGVIRGFAPQASSPAASPRPSTPGRSVAAPSQTRPQAAASPRSHQSPAVVSIPRHVQSQTYSPAYRPQGAPSLAPRSAPAPRAIAPSAPSPAPRAAIAAPSGGGGGHRGGGGAAGGGGGNRGGGGGGGGGGRGGRDR